MPVLHSTEPVAETWGRLAAEAMKRGRPRPQNDMWVAAVCITYGLPLATLNLKDYQDFADHDGLEFVKVGSCR
jgi:predicted nucleic acid-binding protein